MGHAQLKPSQQDHHHAHKNNGALYDIDTREDIETTPINGLFRLKNGLTNHHYVTANPNDLAPTINILTDTIDDKLRTADRSPDKPLVILLGEEHATPSHKMIQISALSYLVQCGHKDDLLFAVEGSYNLLSKYIEGRYELSIPKNFNENLHIHDPKGHLLLHAILEKSPYPYAPQSDNHLFKHYLHHNISVLFNDAGRDGDILSPSAPLTHAIAKDKYGIDLYRTPIVIDTNNPDFDRRSVDIRNDVMVTRALHTAKSDGRSIIVQHCGQAHTHGNEEAGVAYSTSLTKRYQEAGCDVMSLYLGIPHAKTDGHHPYPEAWDNNPDALIVDGVSDQRYFKGQERAENTHITTLQHTYANATCPFGDVPVKAPTSEEMLEKLLALPGVNRA